MLRLQHLLLVVTFSSHLLSPSWAEAPWHQATGKSMPPSSRPGAVPHYGGATTDITGLRMEDIAGNLRDILDNSARSLRLSDLPLSEIAKISAELEQSQSSAGPPLKRWVESGNLAKYNGLKTEPYVTIPVDVNLVFLGFTGDGHYKLNLREEDLRPWFEHMEHKMSHTKVPVSELGEGGHQPSKRTHVYYRYNFHVVELHPDVDAIVEAIIWDNARPEDPWSDEAIPWTSQDMHQVDVIPLENALDDLITTLRLNASYTLFLMNPKLPYPDFNYGYRHGFSEAELNRLHENATLVEKLMKRDKTRPMLKMNDDMVNDVHVLKAEVDKMSGVEEPEKKKHIQEEKARLDKMVKEMSNENVGSGPSTLHLHAGGKPAPRGRPKYKDMRHLSQAWAAIYKEALHDLTYWQRHPAEEPEEDAADDQELENAYTQELKTVLGRPKDKTLPRDMLFEVMATRLIQSDSPEDKEYLRATLEDKHAKEDCLTDNWVGKGRFAFIDFTSGPFEWGPIVGGKGVRSYRTIPDIVALKTAATDFTAGGQWNNPEYVNKVQSDLRSHGLEHLQKEKEMLLVVLGKQCQGVEESSSDVGNTCQELRHKLSAVEAFIKTHKNVDTSDQKTLQQLSFITGGPHEGANISLVQHSMFAKLGSIIETTQRQLFTPSASILPSPYKPQVYFHLYIISNHETYQPDSKQHFDFAKFQKEIEAFKLPRQQFHFVTHKYSMADDHSLAVAYANAIRSAVVATLKVDGRFVATKRMYLDSQVLQKHLQLLHDHLVGRDQDMEAGIEKRDIPIFLFSMDFPLPVFIDKHYQARALEDMVIAVQSDELEWESHLSCNGKPIVWNLRNPLRAVLAATAHHLAGVLPMHLNYDEAHGKVSQDWLWSVGCSPLSHTALHTSNFSSFHLDAAHRNYIADGLSESLELANEGVTAMKRTATNLDNLPAAKAAPNDRLVQMHVAVKLSWKKALDDVRKLDFQSAIPHVHSAVRNARHFKELAIHTEQLLLLSACLHPVHNAPFDWGMVFMVAAAVAAVALYYLFVPVKTKPKLN